MNKLLCILLYSLITSGLINAQINSTISLQQRIQEKQSAIHHNRGTQYNRTIATSLPEQDCNNAIIVCQQTFSVASSYVGVGSNDEIPANTSCLGGGEKNSVWYTFTTNSSGDIQFLITPNNLSNDYDFALYDITNQNCSNISNGIITPLRCSFSATGGTTGLSINGSNTAEGAAGSNYCSILNSLAGKTYALIISNYSSSQSGYKLDFGGTTADIYTGIASTMQQVTSYCGSDSIILSLSRPVINNSIEPNGSDFTLTGTGGPYTITAAHGLSLTNSNQIHLKTNPVLSGLGPWTLNVVSGSDGNTLMEACGSASTSISSISFTAQPVSSIIGPSSVCKGSTFTLTTGPATTYTWSGSSIPVSQLNQPFISITTSTAGTLSFSIQSNGSCGVSSYTKTVNVKDGPITNFYLLSGTPLCTGIPISFTNTSVYPCTLSGSGVTMCNCGAFLCNPTPANNLYVSYNWEFGDNSSLFGSGNNISAFSPVHTYTTSGTYTVLLTASSALGLNVCPNTHLLVINVLASPFITTSSYSLCTGTSAQLYANGASSYTWSTGQTTTSISVSPTITTIYSLTGDNNNCSNALSISVNANCSDVWPGDSNSDGVADNLDVLELGLHYMQTGATRSVTSNAWQSYYSTNWSGTITNGKNLNHSDCNGDGIINYDDTLAIYNNYGLVHAFKPANQTTTNPQLSIVPDQAFVVKGTWGSSSIYLGDATTPISNINGAAFTVDFDHSLIESNDIYLEYQNSFIDVGQNLHFRKLDFSNDKIYTATTHTSSNNITGNGKIAVLHYKIKSSLTTDETLNLSITQGNQSDALGNITPLTSGTASVIALGVSTGLNEFLNTSYVSINPNPTNGTIRITSSNDIEKIEVTNVTGQILFSETAHSKSHSMNLESLSNGVYFVKAYYNSNSPIIKKIVIQK